ncbi:hypothetical protein C7C46_10260 [Streptomyces tateyamensis]|uniref:Uncharacterized protein n=1 Tax=Streptomyces tateyamensis TaxID=565073 RepID=A0A2V4P0E0_9ACTN|nr:hypothetical protein [Streptomyces tateyamensis]PYC82726.1 hypothetical protein C7C46_10260 [Streptomyces tateyamensis]
MASDDWFEAELTHRLRTAAEGLGAAEPPLAELRQAGRRRARTRQAHRVAAAADAVLLLAGLGWGLAAGGGTAGPATGGWPSPQAGSPYRCPGATEAPGRTPNGADPTVSEGAAQRLGEGQYREVYSGTCGDSSHHAFYVYRLRGAKAFDQAVRAAAEPGVTVHFVDSKYPQYKLRELADRIIDDPYWHERGVVIQGTWALPDGSGVQVGVLGDLKALRPQVIARYGPMVAGVEQGAANSGY